MEDFAPAAEGIMVMVTWPVLFLFYEENTFY